jgi:peroxiredoxin family protein
LFPPRGSALRNRQDIRPRRASLPNHTSSVGNEEPRFSRDSHARILYFGAAEGRRGRCGVAEVEQKNKMSIIAWSGDLDKIWPTMILSTTAAASGMEVSIFFTFWGLFTLVKPGVRVTGDNWMQKMLAMMNRPGIDHTKLSKMNFKGMGPMMMKKLAREHKVASPGELLDMAKDMGVKLMPCQMTMDLLGLKREDMIDGLEPPLGAASALLEMKESAVQLFI